MQKTVTIKENDLHNRIGIVLLTNTNKVLEDINKMLYADGDVLEQIRKAIPERIEANNNIIKNLTK